MSDDRAFQSLEAYLASVPAVQQPFGHGHESDGAWWIKFSLDIEHPLAWHVVQEMGHVLNYLSIDERLPTVFKPVSPPPYMNVGPTDFLSCVIECTDKDFKPGTVAKWLEGRLSRPVNDTAQWVIDE
jgi:hypothetical protein